MLFELVEEPVVTASFGMGAPLRQGPLRRELEDRPEPLQLARAVCLGREVGEPFVCIRVATAHGELGQDRLGQQVGRR